MSREYSVELLIDHAEGLLDAKASDSINASRKENPQMDEVLVGIELFLADNNHDREKLEKYLKDSQTPLQALKGVSTPSTRKPFFRSPLILMAAAVLVAVSLVWVFGTADSGEYLASVSSEHYSLPNYRSTDYPERQKALAYYENQEYEKAISIFEVHGMTDNYPLNTFTLGMCYFYTSKFEMARSVLQAQEVQDSKLANRANWFSALAAWNLSECQEAKKLFEDLQNTELRDAASTSLKHLKGSSLCPKE